VASAELIATEQVDTAPEPPPLDITHLLACLVAELACLVAELWGFLPNAPKRCISVAVPD
jgi:hypothetical protein